jgi:hypothetical protein
VALWQHTWQMQWRLRWHSCSSSSSMRTVLLLLLPGWRGVARHCSSRRRLALGGSQQVLVLLKLLHCVLHVVLTAVMGGFCSCCAKTAKYWVLCCSRQRTGKCMAAFHPAARYVWPGKLLLSQQAPAISSAFHAAAPSVSPA